MFEGILDQRSQRMCNQLRETWEQWLDDIHADIQQSLFMRYIWKDLQALMNDEPNTRTPPIFDKWMRLLYSSTLPILVRRQVDERNDVISLARLLSDILNHPGVLSIQSNEVRHDLSDLKNKTKDVRQFASKKVAHIDELLLPTQVSYDQAHESLDVLEKLLVKYLRLLGRNTSDDLSLVIDGGWKNVFLEPWITRKQGTFPRSPS